MYATYNERDFIIIFIIQLLLLLLLLLLYWYSFKLRLTKTHQEKCQQIFFLSSNCSLS